MNIFVNSGQWSQQQWDPSQPQQMSHDQQQQQQWDATQQQWNQNQQQDAWAQYQQQYGGQQLQDPNQHQQYDPNYAYNTQWNQSYDGSYIGYAPQQGLFWGKIIFGLSSTVIFFFIVINRNTQNTQNVFVRYVAKPI